MNTKVKKQQLTEVWGDTVALKEMLISTILGVVLTMAFFLVGRSVFLGMGTIEASLAKGYSLLVGICGCFLAAFISAKMFKPKRIIEEHMDTEDIEVVLASVGMTVEEESEALSQLDPKLIAEMEDLELYNLLALIPEGSPNYKPIYKQRAQAGKAEKEGKVC
jgi:hypothetical protein